MTGSDVHDQNYDAVLIYDGLCVMCNAAVRFVLRHDRELRIMFAPIQSAYAERIRQEHPELAKIDSIFFVTGRPAGGTEVRTRSDAAIAVGEYLQVGRLFTGLLRILPRRVRDTLYDGIAAVRYRAFGRLAACPVPPAEVRDRFLL